MQIIRLYLILVIIISLLSSCSTYMQVQQMSTSENVKMVDHTLQYEDDNCVIYYYLWSEGGNPSFVFYNKSDSNIYLDLASCFFIRNGVAFDYYLQREYGVSESQANVSAARVGGMQTDWVFGQQQGVRIGDYTMAMVNERSRSMVISEKQVLTIPARSMRRISEYDWLNGLYTGCNLNVKPEQGVKSDVTFTRDNTPLVVENRLQYEIEGVQHQVENEFYLSKVTNMKERDAVARDTVVDCDGKRRGFVDYYWVEAANTFYVPYSPSDKDNSSGISDDDLKGNYKKRGYYNTITAIPLLCSGLEYKFSYQFNPYLNLGANVGYFYDYMWGAGSNIFLGPALKVNTTNTRVSLYGEIKAGLGYGTWGSSFYPYLDAEVGLDVHLNKKFILNVGLFGAQTCEQGLSLKALAIGFSF